MISKKALDEFKTLYKKRFDKKLFDKDVLRKATNLLNLYRAVYGDTLSENLVKKQKDNDKK